MRHHRSIACAALLGLSLSACSGAGSPTPEPTPPERTPTPTETPEPATKPVLHTVAKGDTLWKIAEKHLGKGARYTEIFEANRPMLSDPDKIYPGQVLRIPAE